MFINGKAAVADVDPGLRIESRVLLPIPNERANWVYYDITLVAYLDAGIVVHRTLPQVDRTADTLASCDISDRNIDLLTGRGVNLVSNDVFTDIVQRMAHSQYWFHLFGQAMRVGEQVPIPGLKVAAGVPTIPYGTQFAYNKIAGNYSGLILWHAQWDLWYTIATAPKKQQTPPQNLAQLIDGDAKIPAGMQAPWTQPDDNATATGPIVLRTPI